VPGDERPPVRAGLSRPEPRPLPANDREAGAAEHDLIEGDLELVGRLPRASNHTLLARVRGGTGETLAVYKPVSGERPLWDFPEGSLAGREVAAYRVARALGWPGVPPTVLRDGPAGPGAVQLFVQMDPRGEHYFTMGEERPEDFRRVALFDAVVNNADRKSGHCLLDTSGRVFVIDHGVCFHQEPKLRTVIWAFAGEPIPGPMAEDLARLVVDLEEVLGTELREVLAAPEVEATRQRAQALLASGTFPHPGPERPYPWPPV
jgi:hypothetical protein